MSNGSTYKACGCSGSDGKRLGRKCPRLRREGGWNPGHGSWYYQIELPAPPGDDRRHPPLRRGGFGKETDARKQLDKVKELLAIAPGSDPAARARIAGAIRAALRATGELPDPARVRRQAGAGQDPALTPPLLGEWLDEWLAGKKKLQPGTVKSYGEHIRLYWKPHLGHVRVDNLRVTVLQAVFDHIEERNDQIRDARASSDQARRAAVTGMRLVGPATCQRIRATLRSALNTYMRQHPGMLPANPAALLELPPGNRPKALVWTAARVRAWQQDFDTALAAARAAGGRTDPVAIWTSAPRPSPVMVWTPEQTTVFLARARRHRLRGLWRLYATRGLRRGEGCGLRRPDTDLDEGVATIRWQIIQLGWETTQGTPKSEAGDRQVALDAETVAELRAHRDRQDRDRDAAGDAWHESGFEFTTQDGRPLHPSWVTDEFAQLAYLAGLPPVRLHDLRHGAATLLLAAGYEMKVVQETLGLSSITIAADTYTSVLPQLARRSAEDVAALIRLPPPEAGEDTGPQDGQPAAPAA